MRRSSHLLKSPSPAAWCRSSPTAPKSATPQFAIDERSLFAASDSQDLANKIDYWIEHPEPRAQMERHPPSGASSTSVSASILKAEDMFRQAMAEPPKSERIMAMPSNRGCAASRPGRAAHDQSGFF